jgi:Undecaprenyl-phosphate glucose phosphotransferase
VKNAITFFRSIYKTTDIFLVFCSFFLSVYLRFGHCSFHTEEKLLLLYAIIMWILAAVLVDYYSADFKPHLRYRLLKTVRVTALFWLLLWGGAFFVKDIPYSRLQLSMFALFQGTFSIIVRGAIDLISRTVVHNSSHDIRVLVVGAGPLGKKIRREIQLYKQLGRRCVGFIDDEPIDSHIIGGFDDFHTIAEVENIQEIIIAAPFSYREKIKDIILRAEDLGLRVHFTTDFSRWYDIPVTINYLGTLPLLTLRNLPGDRIHSRVLKRTMDICLSLFGLIILSPLFGIIALAIKRTSPGPVFFSQTRTGYRNNNFECLKFRSMKPKTTDDPETEEETEARKTALGSFMRKTNIDELPQLINVLQGEMSLVGPRPHMLSDTDIFRSQVSEYMRRNFMKPGITGLAQVKGYRGHVHDISHIQKRVEYDLFYIENWSILLDIRIILQTLFSKQSRLNAY